MRISRRVPVVLATALAITTVGGVAAAVADHPTSAKACVSPKGTLALANTKGKCASGTSAITLGATGPAGPRGPQGPAGDPGPAENMRVNFSQTTVEASTVTHYLFTAGKVNVIASCQGTSGTPSLVLSLTGLTVPVAYTATEISNASGSTVTTLAHGTTAALQAAGATPSTVTKVFDTETTSTASSDLITLAAATPDGTQVTATLDAEVNSVAGGPACTVGGTVAAA